MGERGRRSVAGAFFFAVIAILFLGGAYAIWPPTFFGNSLSEMTIDVLIRAVASPVLAIVGLEFLGALAVVVLSDS